MENVYRSIVLRPTLGVKLRASEKCKYCTDRRSTCIKGSTFRFRPVKSVKFNGGEDVGSAEQSLEFGASQTWVDIPRSCKPCSESLMKFGPPRNEHPGKTIWLS